MMSIHEGLLYHSLFLCMLEICHNKKFKKDLLQYNQSLVHCYLKLCHCGEYEQYDF